MSGGGVRLGSVKWSGRYSAAGTERALFLFQPVNIWCQILILMLIFLFHTYFNSIIRMSIIYSCTYVMGLIIRIVKHYFVFAYVFKDLLYG
jgi:hypothetical protein